VVGIEGVEAELETGATAPAAGVSFDVRAVGVALSRGAHPASAASVQAVAKCSILMVILRRRA
jgi:hypothetical protein